MREIRILLVDDEIMAIRHFRRVMEQCAEPYEIVGEASNGREALNKIGELNPDIVFADVRMPVMDGLELAEAVKTRYPSVKVILLTAYRDFEYARHGMEAGAAGYLVKHEIDAARVDEVMQKVFRELDLEKRKERVYLEENLKKFLLSESPGPEIPEHLGYERYHFILLDVIVRQPLYLSVTRERDTFFPAEILERQMTGEAVFCKAAVKMSPSTYAVVLFVDRGLYENEFHYRLQVILNTVQGLFREQGMEVWIMVSGPLARFGGLPGAYREQRLYEPYVYRERKTVILTEDRAGRRDNDYSRVIQARDTLLAAVENPGEHRADPVQFFDSAGSVCTLGQYLNILNDLTLRMIRRGEGLGLLETEDWRRRRKESFEDPRELEQWIMEICRACICGQIRADEKQYSDKVRRALDYMKESYASPLTSEEICGYLGISESHFRRIFREEVGMKPMEYLNRYRIEQAQRLLKSGHKKVQDVYEQVGFSSSQYFSKVFKKMTGESPWQYQQKGGDRE